MFPAQNNIKAIDVLHGWVNGGAGIVVSAGLVDMLDLQKCLSWYPHNWNHGVNAADVVFSCCITDYWKTGRITHHRGFFREGPGPRQYECECLGLPCTMDEAEAALHPTDVISYHHISPETIEVRGCEHCCLYLALRAGCRCV